MTFSLPNLLIERHRSKTQVVNILEEEEYNTIRQKRAKNENVNILRVKTQQNLTEPKAAMRLQWTPHREITCPIDVTLRYRRVKPAVHLCA